jgi:undecaprenyl-diphosphatase
MFSDFWQRLEEWDQALFIKLNSGWTNPFFDAVLPWFRHSATWIPLYVFLLVFILINLGRNRWWWILLFITTIAMTDMIGTYIFKHNFERLRPCSDPDLYSYVRLLVKNCSGGYSFISNHAANHFGMAAFFYFTLKRWIPKYAWIGLVWAAIICYSQVYVGVHYPIDVISGAIIGLLIGRLTAKIFANRTVGPKPIG